ncbi:MAG: hypothetical protein F4X20_04745 [Dehalococcoidia bacterium]|nr:hypothetical protein [Dehalococcoidia bacterium]
MTVQSVMIDTESLYTISAGGYSATVDAFARDPDAGTLWFVSMVGAEKEVKSIWGALLKQPPDPAHLVRGVDGMAISGGYHRCAIPPSTIGTWTTKIQKLPSSGGWHALVFTRVAEYAFERDDFLLLMESEEDAAALHYRFLDRRSPLPLHHDWAGWLWERGRRRKEIEKLDSQGIIAYRCSPDSEALREDLSMAVGMGALTLPNEGASDG